MNRREFLKLMGIGAASVAAPKLYFDYGKNLHLYPKTRLIVFPISYTGYSDLGASQIIEAVDLYVPINATPELVDYLQHKKAAEALRERRTAQSGEFGRYWIS